MCTSIFYDSKFPSSENERWVAVAEDIGYALTYLILNSATETVAKCSVIRTVTSLKDSNYFPINVLSTEGRKSMRQPHI